MATKEEIEFNVETGLSDEQEWSAEKLADTKKIIKGLSAKGSSERRLKNEFLAIQYKKEAYAEAGEHRITKPMPNRLSNILQTFSRNRG